MFPGMDDMITRSWNSSVINLSLSPGSPPIRRPQARKAGSDLSDLDVLCLMFSGMADVIRRTWQSPVALSQ